MTMVLRFDPNYRVVHVTDENTGMTIREFYRARPFTDDFSTPCRRVMRINAPASTPLYAARPSLHGPTVRMNAPVQVIVVLPPDAASNKRVHRPEPSQQTPPPQNSRWPLHHPLPDAEIRRQLDAARREIVSSRGEMAPFLRRV